MMNRYCKSLKAKLCSTLFGCIFLIINAYGQVSSSISFHSGIEGNNLKWSIAGDMSGQNPNILSQLKFKDITSLGTQIIGEVKIKKILLIANAGAYRTIHGSGTDIDYSEDNQQSETYNLNFQSNTGYSQNAGFSIIYNIWKASILNFYFGVSYSSRKQKYMLTSDEVSSLKSSYKAATNAFGPYLLMDFKLLKKLNLIYSASINKLTYSADANWNLFAIYMHPRSFAHEATGITIKNSIQISRNINSFLDLVFSGTVISPKYSYDY